MKTPLIVMFQRCAFTTTPSWKVKSRRWRHARPSSWPELLQCGQWGSRRIWVVAPSATFNAEEPQINEKDAETRLLVGSRFQRVLLPEVGLIGASLHRRRILHNKIKTTIDEQVDLKTILKIFLCKWTIKSEGWAVVDRLRRRPPCPRQ